MFILYLRPTTKSLPIHQHIYSKHCLNAKQEEHPVLLTEAPLNPRRNRDQMAEVFFESLQSPALYWTAPSVLSLYASGRTTGVVLDVGEGVTHAVPVYEGMALPHSVTRSNVGGRDVTLALQRSLRRAGLNLTTTAEVDFLRDMKEQVCYLTPTPVLSDESAAAKEAQTVYQLPDGQAITLGAERYQAPSILFDPSLMGSEEMGAADILTTAIAKSDLELRAKLFGQVVVAGGSTLTPGWGDRLLQEVRSRAPAHARIRISAPPERLYSPYVGGSILASLATFRHLWVDRAAYEEHGSNILHRREL
jgi:centractin